MDFNTNLIVGGGLLVVVAILVFLYMRSRNAPPGAPKADPAIAAAHAAIAQPARPAHTPPKPLCSSRKCCGYDCGSAWGDCDEPCDCAHAWATKCARKDGPRSICCPHVGYSGPSSN